MTAELGRPELFAVGYLWPVAIAGFLLGTRSTALFGAAALAGLVLGSRLSGVDLDPVTLLADAVVLGMLTLVIALVTTSARRLAAQLERDRRVDAAALRIAERIRSTLELETVLRSVVAELGAVTGAARAVIRLLPEPETLGPLIEWARPGVAPIGDTPPPATLLHMYGEGSPVVLEDARTADAETRAYLEAIGMEAVCAYPVHWQGRIVAAVGVTETSPRAWSDVEPLLARLAPQIAAAIAQADAYERQQATVRRLSELTELRERLVANVSHELRTPLTSVLGFLHTLERRDQDLDEDLRGSLVAVARREAERLARIVDDLLLLARLDRQTLSLRRERVRLAAVAAEAAAGLDADGRAVVVDVDPDLAVEADADRLVQILRNLLWNALEHGAGTVRLEGARTAAGAVLHVSDEGSGVDPTFVPELFTPFAHAGSARSTGLGLAIARGLAEAHGGTLEYAPAAPGAPHRFVLTLPLGEDQAGSSTAPRRATRLSGAA